MWTIQGNSFAYLFNYLFVRVQRLLKSVLKLLDLYLGSIFVSRKTVNSLARIRFANCQGLSCPCLTCLTHHTAIKCPLPTDLGCLQISFVSIFAIALRETQLSAEDRSLDGRIQYEDVGSI